MAKKTIYTRRIDKIKLLMKSYEISIPALQAESELSRRTLDDVLSGKRNANPATLKLIEICIKNLRKGLV